MKIEELTQKIYTEGIEKAEKAEQELLEEARKRADTIVREAERKAEELEKTALDTAEASKESLARELKLAGELAVGQIEERITDCLVDALLPENVESALDDPAFMQKLIISVAEKWNPRQTNVDVRIILPDKDREAMSAQFLAKAKKLLDRGLEVTFSKEVNSGFRVQPKDGSYRVSFEKESFVAFFREFLRERTRTALFPREKVAADERTSSQKG